MRVMKFGGTSVGSAARMQHVARLINGEQQTVVVLSAMSGTTNALLTLCQHLYRRDVAAAEEAINTLEKKYLAHVEELYASDKYRALAATFINEKMALLRGYAAGLFTSYEEKEVVAQGELLSTTMMYYYLLEQGIAVVLLPALDFMRLDKDGEPDATYIRAHLTPLLSPPTTPIFLTQGFICRNAYGEIDNLKRGGSDYTASLIGAALSADEIQIWTDIDGMHNSDPRYVERTDAVHQLHFEEAAELAYFGAKILHPTCVQPAQKAGIPVRLLNTMQPAAEGTIINNTLLQGTIKAVAAKDNITAIKVKSSRMLLATGFLREIFEIFEHYHTPIDLVTTSEVGVSMSIDDDRYLTEIVAALQTLGAVSVDRDMCIVCIVGDLNAHSEGIAAHVMAALKDIPVRMISYGGSNYNISLLIHQTDKAAALQRLSTTLFYT